MNGDQQKEKVAALRFKLSLPLLLIVAFWGAVLSYSIQTGSSAPDATTGRTTSLNYKERTIYVTRLEYGLIITLLPLAVCAAPLLLIITSPKSGIFKYDK
jgi:hypothetical protein